MTSFKRAFSDADISWMKNLHDGDHTGLQDAAVELERVYAYVKALEALKAKADEMANTINAYGEYPWLAHEYLEAAKEVE